MDVEPTRRRSSPSALFSRLDGGRWPERSQRLIEAGFAQGVDRLTELLQRCLVDCERKFFTLAERTHRPDVQQDCLASRQLVLREQSNVLDRFIVQLSDAFNRLDEGPRRRDASAGSGWQALELVDPVEQEREMTMGQLVARGEVRHSHVLHELGYRLAVLIAAPPLEGEALPLGPHALIDAIHRATLALALPPAHHLLLLRSFDQHVLQPLGPVYDAINARWQEDGILPNLRSTARARAIPARAKSANVGQAPEQDQPAVGKATSASAGGQSIAHVGSSSSIQVLESLRNLLAQRGDASPTTAPHDANSHGASTEELQAAMNALQQHVMEVTDNAGRELRSAQRLREELLQQLNTGKPSGSPRVELTDEQGDKVELVAMLFEQLGQQLHESADGRAFMGGLQMPMLNMAVTDHSFFETREHPARKLLDTVAAAAHDWLDGSDDQGSRAMAEKLGQLVTRVNREPPSAGLYTALLADIEHHLSLLTRKAQTSERRHVEAAKGREKLDQARRQAGDMIAERFAESPPHGLLRTLLERAWSDVLALTLLRHGRDSDAFAEQLLITDQLLGREPVDDPLLLQAQIEAGLQQIGMHTEESEQLAQRLVRNVTRTHRAPQSGSRTASDPTLIAAGSRLASRSENSVEGSPAAAAPRSTVARTPKPTVPRAVSDENIRSTSAPAARLPPSSGEAKTTTETEGVGRFPAGESANSQKPPPPTRAKAPASADLLSSTQLVQRLEHHQRLGEHAHRSDQNTVPGRRATAEPVLDVQEARIYKRLLQLPFGTWFEFLDPASGKHSQHKLAWFSPVTGNVLFVTRRGTRSESMSLAQLAHAVAGEQAREMPRHSDTMLDRAWKNLTRSLRQSADPRQAARPEAHR